MFSERFLGFEWFGLAHGLAIFLMITLLVLMIIFKEKGSPTIDLYLRRSVAILMVVMEWTFYTWSLIGGGFQTSLLPFGVCAISMYVTAYALWFKSEKVFKIIFPWAIAGALISLIVADLNYTFPHFRYIHYFGNHSLFLLGNLYLLIVIGYRITYRDILKSSLILLIYAAIMYPINFLLDSNHLFLREVPHEVAPMYAFLGDFWVIGFVISIAILFQIIYAGVFLYQRQKA
jgi:hypothetical integral membrane protein (TIGR02206 family)